MTEVITPEERRAQVMKLVDELVACDKVLDELRMRIGGLYRMHRDIRRVRLPEMQEEEKKWLQKRKDTILAIAEAQKHLPQPIINFIHEPKQKGTIGTLSPRK